MTLRSYTDGPISGGYSATFPTALHGEGILGVNNRWLAKEQGLADGATVANMKPSIGSVTLSAAGTAPVMATDEYGLKTVRFDGVDDILTAASIAGVLSVTVVGRIRPAIGTEQGVLHTGGTYLNRSTSANCRVVVAGASSKFPNVDPTAPKYHVFTIVASGSVARYAIDGVAADVAGGTGTHTQLTIGRASTALFGQLDALEWFTSNRALSAVECQAAYAAMKANWGNAVA